MRGLEIGYESMKCPSLSDLPLPRYDRVGWPWTVESRFDAESHSPTKSWPKISVVVPSLNQSEFIEETLRSILLQAYPNFELFVMDAGSTDGTVEILHKYSRWVTFWRSHRDGGQAAAINEGLQLSTGDILCYLNSDDIFCAGAFFSVAREFEVTAYSTPRLFAFEGTIRDTDGRETSVPPSQENYVTPWLSSAHSLFQPACF